MRNNMLYLLHKITKAGNISFLIKRKHVIDKTLGAFRKRKRCILKRKIDAALLLIILAVRRKQKARLAAGFWCMD